MTDARSPKTISGLVGWYTGLSAEVTSGSVSSWKDISGQGNHATTIQGSPRVSTSKFQGPAPGETLISFHYGNFDNYYSDGTVANAAKNGRIYADTRAADLPPEFGSIRESTTANDQITYKWFPPITGTADVLVVAGGGGGGGGWNGGGGGAGGLRFETSQNISNETGVTIKVGKGGQGGSGEYVNNLLPLNGKNSSFDLITATGGGAGAQERPAQVAQVGGSGGGGVHGSGGSLDGANGTSGQGNAGGTGVSDGPPGDFIGGGGGGAGTAGGSADGPTDRAGDGGAGLSYYGSTYAGGGGGERRYDGIGGVGGVGGGGSGGVPNGTAGTNHTGGGGGAGAASAGALNNGSGGAGGSGIVIVNVRINNGRGTTQFPFLWGDTTDSITFPTTVMNYTPDNTDYTLFHVTRYYNPNGTPTRGRIFNGVDQNWLSGHHAIGETGVAYHNVWVASGANRHNDNWFISTDQKQLYRTNGVTRGTDSNGTAAQISINNTSLVSQPSDWAVTEVIVFNRELTSAEYLSVEAYLSAKYFISGVVPATGVISGSLLNAFYYNGNDGPSDASGFPVSIPRLGRRIGTTYNQLLNASDFRDTGVFDDISVSPVAAFSLRRLYSNYEGPQVRIRRSSDNLRASIYMDANGVIRRIEGTTGTDLSTWLNGATAYVTDWYDQSRRGKFISQPDTTQQPTLNITANQASYIRFQNKKMRGINVFDTNTITNMHMIMGMVENVRSNNVFISLHGETTGGDNRTFLHASYDGGNWYWDLGDAYTTSTGNRAYTTAGIAVGTKVVFSGYKSSTEVKNAFRLNKGTRIYSPSSTSANVFNGLTIGLSTTDHSIYELLLFPSTLSSTDEGTIEDNLTTYIT